MARGVELMRPVSFLFVEENVEDKSQYELNGLIQQQLAKPILMVLVSSKVYSRRLSPYDQSSATLKSVHLYSMLDITPEQPYRHVS